MSVQIIENLGSLLPLGEKKKLLHQFIAGAEEHDVNNILKECESLPSTQYNLLKCLLASKFHRFDLIIELLCKEDAAKLRRTVSQRWLYEREDSQLTDSEFLIDKLFPNISFNCRQKLLNRIGRYMQNEDKADKIWNAVEQRYGFNVAFPILQACSRRKINSVLINRKVELYGYQLVQILQKHPDVGLEYLKNNHTYFGSTATNSYRSPLNYLYRNRSDDFVDLCINHSDKINCFKFGRDRSTNIIRAYRSRLLEHPTKFSSLLKVGRIRRQFSDEEFQTFFESYLPKEPSFVQNYDIWSWVNIVPRNRRLEMVNQAFMNVFKINLDGSPEFMGPEYIALLPDEERLSVVQWKIENDTNNYWSFKGVNVHIYYNHTDEDKKRAWSLLKPISYSVPDLKKLLLIEQDARTRAILSKYLIETCYINADLPHLLNVLELLKKSSRNDQGEVCDEIFRTLSTITEKLELSKEQWNIIMEMIQVALIFKDNRDYSDGEKEMLIEKCIAFHLSSQMPLKNLVSIHIRLKIQISSSSWTNSYIKNPADRRTILELYAKELENLQLSNNLRSYKGNTLDSEKFTEFIANLVEEICNFNKSQSKASYGLRPILISSHQWLISSLEEMLKEEENRINKSYTTVNSTCSWNFAKQLFIIIQILIKEQNMSSYAFNISEDVFSKILLYSPRNSILMHFLKKDPSTLIQNWPATLSKMLIFESSLEFMRKVKSWNYSILVDHSIKICREIINPTIEIDAEVNVKQKCNAILVLSVLSEPSDFLALTAEFYPTEEKVDVFADNSEEDYQIRQTFAMSIVNVTVPHLTFPATEKFCVGDYLKLAVGALYSQTSRAAEGESLNFLRQKLFNSPVSLQKHILRQFCNISSVEEKSRILKEIQSSNISIRREIFLHANKLLRSSPSEDTWKILKTIIEKTSADDTGILQYLHSTPSLGTCPLEYISDYIRTSSAMLRNIEGGKIDKFMRFVVNIIDKIPEKTLDEIILLHDSEQVTFCSTLCVAYLQSSSSTKTLEYRLSNVWSILQNTIRNGWDRQKPNFYEVNSFDYPTNSLVFSFVSSLCLEQIKDSSETWRKTQICQSLLEKFKAEYLTKCFKEILYLELTMLLVKEIEYNGIERLRLFGRNLAQFTDYLIDIYEGQIICILKDTFNEYVQACFADEFIKNMGSIVELVDGILETSKTRQNQIISMKLLQNANPKASNLLTSLEKINNALKESNDVVAQIYKEFERK